MTEKDFILKKDSNLGFSPNKKTSYIYGKNKIVLRVISIIYNCLTY